MLIMYFVLCWYCTVIQVGSFVLLYWYLKSGSAERANIICLCSGSTELGYVCVLLFPFLVLCVVSGSTEVFFIFIVLLLIPDNGNLTVQGFS